jgi:hypothetical protein
MFSSWGGKPGGCCRSVEGSAKMREERDNAREEKRVNEKGGEVLIYYPDFATRQDGRSTGSDPPSTTQNEAPRDLDA